MVCTMTFNRFQGQECEICGKVVKVGQRYVTGKHGELISARAYRDVAHADCTVQVCPTCGNPEPCRRYACIDNALDQASAVDPRETV